MRGLTVASLACVCLATQASAQAPTFPKTADEHYAVGERFARCTAHITFVASIAKRAGSPDAAKFSADVARGWQLAGTILLVDGLSTSRQPNVEEVFDSLVQAKLSQLKALYELKPDEAAKEMQREYASQCEPYAGMQKAIIEALRRGVD